MMKNAFYFMLKALFVLKIFKFQSCFGYDEEMLDQEDKVNFKIYDVTTWLASTPFFFINNQKFKQSP